MKRSGTTPKRETARRFQRLAQLLKETLEDVTVYKVGEVEIDAYVVGKTRSGALAGVKTKLVET